MFVCIGPNVMVRIRRVTGRCDRKGSAREMKSSLSGCQSPSLVPSIRIVLRRAHGVPGNVVRATALFTQSNRTANTEGRLQGTRKTGDGTARRSRYHRQRSPVGTKRLAIRPLRLPDVGWAGSRVLTPF